ncbi:MAG: PQQ-binding-like beta-propeller repeat protein [Geodermatophilaceae bacterium]
MTWLAVLVIALVAGLILAGTSNAGSTDVRTAAGPPVISSAPLAEQLESRWSTKSAADDQRSVASGTVITANEYGVRGLDPLTGEERWHYLRPNAAMCDLTVLDDVVVAIFRTTGRCNEAVALEAGSGVRRWYRNVGFSDQLSLLGSGTAALAATPGGIAVLDAVGNSIRWRYNPPQGCELASIGIGINGVVVLESCSTGTTWLAQFDLYSGDQQWRVAPPMGEVTVLGVDGVVSLLVGQQLRILSARNGSLLSTVDNAIESAEPLASEESAESAASLFAATSGRGGVPLVYLAGRLYGVDPANGTLLWRVAATGVPALSDLGVVVPEGGDYVTRDASTGQELDRSVIADQGTSPERGQDGLLRIEQAGPVLIAISEDGLSAYS